MASKALIEALFLRRVHAQEVIKLSPYLLNVRASFIVLPRCKDIVKRLPADFIPAEHVVLSKLEKLDPAERVGYAVKKIARGYELHSRSDLISPEMQKQAREVARAFQNYERQAISIGNPIPHPSSALIAAYDTDGLLSWTGF